MNIKQNEIKVYEAVKRGDLEIDEKGRIWRVRFRQIDRWTRKMRVIYCTRRRAEHLNTYGYLQLQLRKNKRRVNASAHRLVWFHFFGPIGPVLTVNHKNGIKNDNRPENLELATSQQQALHASRVLKTARCANQRGEKHHQPRFTNEQITEIRQLLAAGLVKQQELADRFHVSQSTISNIHTRRTWTHLP